MRLLTLPLLLLLAGCAAPAEERPEPPPAPAAAAAPAPAAAAPADRVVVELEASQFAPAVLDVAPGTEIAFANRDAIAHTATAVDGADFDSGALEDGGEFSFTAARAGDIHYICTFHPGMTGTITVS